MANGGMGAWTDTATTENWTITSTGEKAQKYHYTVELFVGQNINGASATATTVKVTVNDGTNNYVRSFEFKAGTYGSTTYKYCNGNMFGLYGGSTGGRIEVSNLTVYGIKL